MVCVVIREYVVNDFDSLGNVSKDLVTSEVVVVTCGDEALNPTEEFEASPMES